MKTALFEWWNKLIDSLLVCDLWRYRRHRLICTCRLAEALMLGPVREELRKFRKS